MLGKLQISGLHDVYHVRKTHALLRLANGVSPLHSTRGYGVATMSRLLKDHHELYDVTNSPLLARFIAPSTCCKPSPLHLWNTRAYVKYGVAAMSRLLQFTGLFCRK